MIHINKGDTTLYNLRRSKNITLMGLSKKTGLTLNELSRIERGVEKSQEMIDKYIAGLL